MDLMKFLTKKLVNPILERNNFDTIKSETENYTQFFISTLNSETEKEKPVCRLVAFGALI